MELTDKELMEILCEIESGLTDWEVEFIEDVTKRVETGEVLSKGRREKAEQIRREKGQW